MVKIRLEGTKKKIKEILPLIENNITVLDKSPYKPTHISEIFQLHLDCIAKKVIIIQPDEKSSCES